MSSWYDDAERSSTDHAQRCRVVGDPHRSHHSELVTRILYTPKIHVTDRQTDRQTDNSNTVAIVRICRPQTMLSSVVRKPHWSQHSELVTQILQQTGGSCDRQTDRLTDIQTDHATCVAIIRICRSQILFPVLSATCIGANTPRSLQEYCN